MLTSSVFGRCFEFVLGMYCASLVARWHSEQKSPLRRPTICCLPWLFRWPCWIRAGTLCFDAVWGLVYAALLLASSRPRSLANRILSHRALVSLGIFSYSVYLIHQPLVITLSRFAVRDIFFYNLAKTCRHSHHILGLVSAPDADAWAICFT